MRRLRRDRRGATVVEHALVLPIFLALVLLLIEAAWQVTMAVALDHGARRGARWVALGQEAPADAASRTDFLAQVVASAAGFPIEAQRLTVTATAFPSHAALANEAAGRDGLGGPDEVVRYVVRYRSTMLTPFARLIVPEGWLDFRSVIIAQNEPFPSDD